MRTCKHINAPVFYMVTNHEWLLHCAEMAYCLVGSIMQTCAIIICGQTHRMSCSRPCPIICM